jgi:hypothetical protein
VDRAILGKAGWIYKSDYGADKYIRRVELFTEAQLEQWRRILEERRDYFERRGCTFLFTLVPDKAVLYPEYLPDWCRPLQAETRMDQLLDYLLANSDVNVLDLRPAMRRAKAKGRFLLHQRTDSHWTEYGAYLAYREIIGRLSAELPGLAYVPFDEESVRFVLGLGGDLTRILGMREQIPENRVQLTPEGGFRAEEVHDLSPPPRLLPLYMRPAVMMQKDRPDLPDAVVYGDSYNRASRFPRFMANSFHRVVFADVRHADFDPDFLERENPHVVILMLVGRQLQRDPPDRAFTRNW